jgi:hypothetical protein
MLFYFGNSVCPRKLLRLGWRVRTRSFVRRGKTVLKYTQLELTPHLHVRANSDRTRLPACTSAASSLHVHGDRMGWVDLQRVLRCGTGIHNE